MAFLFATAYAIAVVIFRLPTDWFDSSRGFRIALALHVELAVFYWLMSTLAALWTSACATPSPGALLAARLGAAGTIVTAISPLAGGTPAMADYFPWLMGNLLFATGFLLFCTGLMAAAASAARAWLSSREQNAWRGAGISSLPTICAAAAALTTWLCGGDSLQDIAWAAGHTLLFAHVSALAWELPRLLAPGKTHSNLSGIALALVSAALPLIPLFAAPGTASFHIAYTYSMAWLLWPPIALVTWNCWRRRDMAPHPEKYAFAAGRIAIALLCLGLALGAAIDGATTLVTAHYHAAVGAVVITRMATTYRWAGLLSDRAVAELRAVRQIVAYAIGLALLAGGLAFASLDHAPRKTSATETVHKGPYFRTGMILSGIGGLFAMAGSLWLVINLTGYPRRISGIPARATKLGCEMPAQAQDGHDRSSEQPGNGPIIVK